MLGIAIINYNKYEKTIECITSIEETAKCEYKIYLLDNASANESFDILSKKYSDNEKIVLIKSDENLGYARGNNLCIEYAKNDNCDYILVSNNDIIFQNDSIDLLLEDIKEGNHLLVEPFIRNKDGSVQICVKKDKPTFKQYMQFSTYLRNLVSSNDKKAYYSTLQPKEKSNVYWASGACFIADMKKFESIGFFDPFTFLYFEEFIISEKAVKNGLTIGFDPNAQVIHYHGASSGGSANLVTRLANFESEIYFFTNYWQISDKQIKMIKNIRCLEVLFTFTKQKKLKQAFEFIKQSKKIVKNRKTMEFI